MRRRGCGSTARLSECPSVIQFAVALGRLASSRYQHHCIGTDSNRPHHRAKMLLSRLLLLPFAVASSVTLYVSSVPASGDSAVIPSPIPLAQIEYDADQPVGTLASFTPPTGSYASDHLLRVGLTDPKSGSWRGIVTSAASFSDQYHKKFIIHVDEKGEPFHIGFGTSAKGSEDEVEVEIRKRNVGPKPVLNKPIVLNAEGKLDGKEPEKTFLQKYVGGQGSLLEVMLIIIQILVGHCSLHGSAVGCRWWRREIRHRWIKASLIPFQYQTQYRPSIAVSASFRNHDAGIVFSAISNQLRVSVNNKFLLR